MELLLEKELRLTPKDFETLLPIDFHLLREYAALELCCSYFPKFSDDRDTAKKLIEEGMARYQIDPAARSWEEFLPLGNAVNLSLEYEGAFVGAAHRHHPIQRLILSARYSSPGIEHHPALAGNWRVVLVASSLISEEVVYHLTIKGLEESELWSYKCMELHTHTVHSDGGATVPQLCRHAMEWEYDGIALTDHNTWSGDAELTPELEAATLPVAHGMEWTTLYGHFLVIGGSERVDCRFIRQDDIDHYLAKIQQVGASVGIAHPCDDGAPFCNGCDWRFAIKDWSLVDYIELWNGPFAVAKRQSWCAFNEWTKRLNEGYKIGVSSGRDWHLLDDEPKRPHVGVTYLGINGPINTQTVVEALKAGRSYITAGPTLTFFVEWEDKRHGLGETVPAGRCRITAGVQENDRRFSWGGFGILPRRYDVVNNNRVIASGICEEPSSAARVAEMCREAELAPGWVRLEVYGDYREETDLLLAVTSSIYVE